MESYKQNCECRTKTYLVKVTQSVCYYPVNWNCDRKNDDRYDHKREDCCDCKRKEHFENNCWERDFESKYWNDNNFNSNYSLKENFHKDCGCRNRY